MHSRSKAQTQVVSGSRPLWPAGRCSGRAHRSVWRGQRSPTGRTLHLRSTVAGYMWLSFSPQCCWVNEGAPQRKTGATASLEPNITWIRDIQRTKAILSMEKCRVYQVHPQGKLIQLCCSFKTKQHKVL